MVILSAAASYVPEDFVCIREMGGSVCGQLGQVRHPLQPHPGQLRGDVSAVHRKPGGLGPIGEQVAAARFGCDAHPSRPEGGVSKEVFEISDILLTDKDDMVQKGYGWMLKEASKKHQEEVFDYVMKWREKMPRTALRYAIEKMPVEMRRKAMAR